VFKEMQTTEIVRIAWHQLEVESKKTLMTVKFEDMTEDGLVFEVAKDGPGKLGSLVIGVNGLMELIENLLKTRGLSLPLLNKIVEKMGHDGLEKILAQGRK
jgi:hypothetical protein